MKLEASSRHSDGYFFEVNSVSEVECTCQIATKYSLPIITGIPLVQKVKNINHVQQLKYIPNQAETFQKPEVFRDQLHKIKNSIMSAKAFYNVPN